MTDPVAALYTHIIAQDDATSLLDTYADVPAVFEEIAPDGFNISAPIVILDPPHNAPRNDTSTTIGLTYDMRVRLYARVRDENGASGYAALNLAAATLAQTLHNSTPSIAGARTSRIAVNGPFSAPTDTPAIGGRLLSLRWNITEA